MDKIINLSVNLKCDPHYAFESFIKEEVLESWLTGVANVEPYTGGSYELFWNPDDKENDSTIGCKITAIEPDRFLSFEWRSPKQYKHFANNADPLTHVVVFFIPIKDGVEVNLIHSGWRSSPEWEEARQWQEKAWQIALQELVNQTNNKT
ncbi:MAG: SRPBCC domain-containing protein [Anaerolineae bacterium]|nr:SRPBCC domain-containing protein [Anaerolineae bacterium]